MKNTNKLIDALAIVVPKDASVKKAQCMIAASRKEIAAIADAMRLISSLATDSAPQDDRESFIESQLYSAISIAARVIEKHWAKLATGETAKIEEIRRNGTVE